MKANPRVQKRGMRIRPHHRRLYYTATASITVSPEIKQGLAAIAKEEGRSLSWVVGEVFRFYFHLKDDTPVEGGRRQLRRVV